MEFLSQPDLMLYSMANRSLYRHAPNWFPTALALQDTGTQRTTWRYSDLLAVLYKLVYNTMRARGRENHVFNKFSSGVDVTY